MFRLLEDSMKEFTSCACVKMKPEETKRPRQTKFDDLLLKVKKCICQNAAGDYLITLFQPTQSECVLNTTICAFTTIVYLGVLVLRINKHNGRKVPIYEVHIKKIDLLSNS